MCLAVCVGAQNCCTIDYNFTVQVNAPLGHEVGQVEASTGDRDVPIDYTVLAGKCIRILMIPVLGSQPAGDMSHKPGGRLPLLGSRAGLRRSRVRVQIAAAMLSGSNLRQTVHNHRARSPSSEIGSSPLKGCEGNCGPGGK